MFMDDSFYQQGENAYMDGKKVSNCPYRATELARSRWLQGFADMKKAMDEYEGAAK